MKPLPKHSATGLTIFSEMSALAQKHDAINLAQGFPDYETDPRLTKLLGKAAEQNFNQYAPMAGNSLLIRNLVTFNRNRNVPVIFDGSEVTIIPGATYGIYTALVALLQPGDEVIVLEPAYDSYIPGIEMNGCIPVFVSLTEDFEVDLQLLKSKRENPRNDRQFAPQSYRKNVEKRRLGETLAMHKRHRHRGHFG